MNAFGIIFTDTYNEDRVGELTAVRPISGVPFGGRYRLIDFMLSSLVGASVSNVGILTKARYGSMMDHLAGGRDWDLNRKNGGLQIITPFARDINPDYLKNKFEALASAHGFIENSLQDYCVATDGNIVANVNFEEVLRCHIEKKADITVIYRSAVPRHEETEIFCAPDGRITGALFHAADQAGKKDVLMNTYIFNRSLLPEIVEKGITYGWNDFNKDFIVKHLSDMKM